MTDAARAIDLLLPALSRRSNIPLHPPMIRISFACLAWLSAVSTLRAVEPTDFRLQRDVAYLPEHRNEKADLYLPLEIAKGTRVPAVLIIHGGGFTGGKRDAARELNIGGTLARNGYIGMSIDYALSAPNKPTWPQNLHDCKTAVRWLRANAERLQIDPDHIGVIGGSAGGTSPRWSTLTRRERWTRSAGALRRILLRGAMRRGSLRHRRHGRLA